VVAYQRTKGRPKGKPQGGNGGSGGDVIVEADPSVATLLRYQRQPHHRATDGTHGEGDLRHGRGGEDLVIPVPLGTIITDEEGTVLADLVEPGHRLVAVKGGRGGRGNAAFVSPKLRAPAIAEQGEYGPEGWFTLELKLAADAALIGFPNAGKSTLISTVSAAKPKVADYPFTTLQPHLGVVAVDEREFVLADIPGLIEGAADGKGLGLEFLRHVERARVLVILLDPSPLQSEPVEDQLRILLNELERYLPELVERPRLVVVSKADLPEASEAARKVPEAMLVSAATRAGLDRFLHATADLVDQALKASPDRPGFVLHRPLLVDLEVRREGNEWVVEGQSARRAVAFADLTVPAAARMASQRLARIGVDRALLEAGAEPGDDVRIGDLVFEFQLPEDAP
jgi:GTP-binding protein